MEPQAVARRIRSLPVRHDDKMQVPLGADQVHKSVNFCSPSPLGGEGSCEKIERAAEKSPPFSKGGLQGGHRVSAPSADSTSLTPLKSPLEKVDNLRSATFRTNTRILSQLQGGAERRVRGTQARKRKRLVSLY